MFDFYNKEHTLRLPKNLRCPHCKEMIHDIILIHGKMKVAFGSTWEEIYYCPKCLVILAINNIERGSR